MGDYIKINHLPTLIRLILGDDAVPIIRYHSILFLRVVLLVAFWSNYIFYIIFGLAFGLLLFIWPMKIFILLVYCTYVGFSKQFGLCKVLALQCFSWFYKLDNSTPFMEFSCTLVDSINSYGFCCNISRKR